MCAYIYAYLDSYMPPQLFLFSVVLVYLSAAPKYILHPINFMFGYYLAWFTFPVMYATRYANLRFNQPEEIFGYLMLISSFLIGYWTLHISIKGRLTFRKVFSLELMNRVPLKYIHYFFVALSIFACFLTMALSPSGVIGWLKNPGQAFQFRDGSGLATILLIFSSGIAMTTSGVYLRKASGYKKLWLIICFLALMGLYLICILHRQRMINYLMLLFLTSLFYVKAKLKYVLPILIFTVGSIILSTYSRMENQVIAGDDTFAFALNYFDTFDALLMSIRYETPEVFGSSFMAFNKFIVGIGHSQEISYSISQELTPIYFPGWSERATVQFPIQTEMYLNGYFIGYIPILILYFIFVGKTYKHALHSGSLGSLYVSLYVMFEIIGHMRGMFIEFTDFYNYPVLIVSYFVLNKVSESFNKNLTLE